MMFNKILVPIDGSKQSSEALKTAIDLAKSHDSKLEILHVMTFTEDVPPLKEKKSVDAPEWIGNYIDRVKENDQRMLSDAEAEAKHLAPGINVSSKLLIGDPGDEIIKEAEAGSFDLIVIGSRGLGGFKGLILGSVSQKVVNKASIKVMVVK